MKIAVDIRALGGDVHSGVQEYTIKLLQGLFRNSDEGDQFVLWSAGLDFNIISDSFSRSLKGQSSIKRAHVNFPSKLVNLSFVFNRRLFVRRFLEDADVSYVPNINYYPVQDGEVEVLTVHDLSFLRYPSFFSFDRRWWHKLIRPGKKVKKAKLILSPSESTKKDLLKFFPGLAEDKIEVVNPGVSQEFTPLDSGHSGIEKLKGKYKLPENYILYLGTLEPRKNVPAIIRAFEGLNSEVNLVIAGPKGWRYKEILRRINDSPAKDRIFLTGPCREEERVFLYNAASVFVYPSFFEGFGLPPLEAMACGTPVVTSFTSSLPEVVGEAGLMVDPRRPEEIQDAIERVLDNRKLRDGLIKKGIKKSREFSWGKAASKVYKLFKEVA